MKTNSYPPTWKTWPKRVCYTLIGTLVSITIVISVKPSNVESGFSRVVALRKSDDTRVLHDGDSVPQISKEVKVPLTHYLPGMTPVIEVTDTTYGKPFYSAARVRDGYVCFELDAGNPQDAGRVFKVRGLLLSNKVNVRFGMPYDAPLSGDDLFPEILLHRL